MSGPKLAAVAKPTMNCSAESVAMLGAAAAPAKDAARISAAAASTRAAP
jgi:hypothetical protein